MPEPAPDGVPRWFWLLAVVPAIALTAIGGVALVLAMLGWYSLPLALGFGVPLLAMGVFLAARVIGGGRTVTRADLLGAIGAVAVALASLAFNGVHPSQHVLVDRDPGSYGVTARWLARDGTLQVDATTGAFEGAPRGVVFRSAATYDTGDGELEYQFNHLVSGALAMGYGIGGQRALFRMPALAAAAALLPLYAFARALIGRAWVAVALTAGFAACLPLVSVARGTYSESFTLLVLWAGLLVLVRLVQGRACSVAAALLAGGLIGATTMTRIDALAYLIPLIPVAAWVWCERRRAAAAALVGSAAVAAVIGAVDGRYFSGSYYADLATQRRQLEVALVFVVIVAVCAALARRWLTRPLAWLSRGRVAVGLGVATTVGLLVAWLVRPSVMTTRGVPNALVSALQQRQGLPVDPTRLYSEDSVRWFAWYLGPITVLAAAVGAGLLVVRALHRREPPAIVLSVVLMFGGLIYLWRPSITPDHIWVMRRFVPLVLPAFLVMAGLAIGWLADAARRRSAPWVGGALAVAGTAVLVIPPALVTMPVRRLAEQAGYLQSVQEICRNVPDDAAVVVAGSYATLVLPESLRAWCGVPVAAMRPDATGEDLFTLAEGWAAECRPLVLVAQDEPTTLTLVNEIGSERAVVAARNDRLLERVVDGVPSHYQPEALTVTVGVVPVVNSCVSAET